MILKHNAHENCINIKGKLLLIIFLLYSKYKINFLN
jgi:hypothetical protein